jgi:DNA-binding winged helix-turn-helix (wHTH) protein/tetratricopeptide (TPR) repeat protein
VAPRAFRLGDFVVEPGADRLVHASNGARHELEPRIMAVLLLLAERHGEVVSSQDLIRDVWRDRPMGDNPVYKAITRLRHALGDGAAEPRYIETIPRKGYRLLVEPRWLRGAQPTDTEPAADLSEPSSAEPPDRPGGDRRTAPSRTRTQIGAGLGLALSFGVIGLAFVGAGPRRGPEPPEPGAAATAAMTLPESVRPLFLQARSELEQRRPGFASRLEADADELIDAAPAFAPGHALRAIACALEADQPTERTLKDTGASAGGADRALECAQSSVRRSLQLDPDLAEAHAATGLLALRVYQQCGPQCDRIGLLDRAESSFEHAVRLDPQLPAAHGWLARVLAERGDLVAAAAEAEAAVRLDPLNPVAVCDADDYLAARGEFELARRRLLALAASPDVPPCAYVRLADVALMTGRREEALRWTQMLGHTSSARAAQIQTARLLLQLGDRAEARRAWQAASATAAVDGGDSRWAALWIAQALDGAPAVASYFDAQSALRPVPARAPAVDEERDWLQFEGLAYALTGRYAEAVATLERVFGASGAPRIHLARAVSESDRANALAWAYARMGNEDRAREVAEGTLVVLDRYAALGFDRAPRFAMVRALSYALAGRLARGRTELERIAGRGWASDAIVAHDPRWIGLRPHRPLALADTASR